MRNVFKKCWWLLLAVTVFGGGFIWINKVERPLELPQVTVGIQTGPANALVMVAQDKGFFAAQGLNVELKEFTAGKFALEAFLGGSLDFSISGDVPVTLATLAGNRFIVPAQVVGRTKNEVRVVARREAGIDIEAKESVRQDPAIVEKLLRGLLAAEKFTKVLKVERDKYRQPGCGAHALPRGYSFSMV